MTTLAPIDADDEAVEAILAGCTDFDDQLLTALAAWSTEIASPLPASAAILSADPSDRREHARDEAR
jgi:hypothetical protein